MNMNRWVGVGRLATKPELRHTPGGVPVTDLRLAVSERYTSPDGEAREDTLWIDVTVWKGQAESCCQYLEQGQEVGVDGRLKTDSWEDRGTGEKRSKIKVVAERVQFGRKPKAKDEHR